MQLNILPKNQQQEVLYELLNNKTVSTLELTKKYYILNVPDVVFRLRKKGLDIITMPKKVTNKFGNEKTIALWMLSDREKAVELYKDLKA